MIETLSQTRWTPEQVLPFIYAQKQGRKDDSLREFEGVKVRMDSLRYSVFKKNLSCVWCGLTGQFFLLQSGTEGPSNRGHLNLFAEEDGKLVLMTKDHIIPKKEGGREVVENMQTMCTTCNWIKAARADIIHEGEANLLELPNPTVSIRQLLNAARKNVHVLKSFSDYLLIYNKYDKYNRRKKFNGGVKNLRLWMYQNMSLLVALIDFHERRGTDSILDGVGAS